MAIESSEDTGDARDQAAVGGARTADAVALHEGSVPDVVVAEAQRDATLKAYAKNLSVLSKKYGVTDTYPGPAKSIVILRAWSSLLQRQELTTQDRQFVVDGLAACESTVQQVAEARIADADAMLIPFRRASQNASRDFDTEFRAAEGDAQLQALAAVRQSDAVNLAMAELLTKIGQRHEIFHLDLYTTPGAKLPHPGWDRVSLAEATAWGGMLKDKNLPEPYVQAIDVASKICGRAFQTCQKLYADAARQPQRGDGQGQESVSTLAGRPDMGQGAESTRRGAGDEPTRTAGGVAADRVVKTSAPGRTRPGPR